MTMDNEGKNLGQADEKYFFHMHNFDEEVMDEVVPEEPPPPTFTEAQMEAAKKQAYAQGHEDALGESKASRSQFIAGLLEKIAMQTQALFGQEDAREKTYEREAVSLSMSVFEKLFPIYHEKHGFTELQDQLLGTLKSQEGLKSIHIRVATSYAEGIGSFMSKLSEKNSDLRFKVTGDESLPEGTVHVAWDDGGAVRDAHALAAQIQDRIQEILAGAQATSHDDDVAPAPLEKTTTAAEMTQEADHAPENNLEEPSDE